MPTAEHKKRPNNLTKIIMAKNRKDEIIAQLNTLNEDLEKLKDKKCFASLLHHDNCGFSATWYKLSFSEELKYAMEKYLIDKKTMLESELLKKLI
jgi:hypothetical protein